MSVFGRFAVAALVFTGSVAVAGYAASNEDFLNDVTSTVQGVTQDMALAGSMISGQQHLAGDGDEGEAGSPKRDSNRIESSSVVTHVELIGGDKRQRIVLLDPEGREVFTHDPEANTTIIAKDVVIPSITLRDDPSATAELRVVTAASPIEVPQDLVQALSTGATDPNVFYRDEL